MALPPGMVLATAVDDSVNTMAWRYVSPGVAATITTQYVTRFHAANAASSPSSIGVMARISAHTLEKSATCGRTYQKMATTSANDTPRRAARLPLEAMSPPLPPEGDSNNTFGSMPAAGIGGRMARAGAGRSEGRPAVSDGTA